MSIDRRELERRLERARRHANQSLDPVTRRLLFDLVHELESQLDRAPPLQPDQGDGN